MKLRYTVGKWVVNKKGVAPMICIDGDPEWPILQVAMGPTLEEAQINANLMGSSPELYEACKAVINHIDTANLPAKVIKQLKTAILKAES